MGGFFLQDIHFPGLPPVILLVVLRLLLAFRLEEVALPGGVTGVFTTKRAIQLGVLLLEFLTMLVLTFDLQVLFFFLVSLSSSDAANFAPAMLSAVSARSQCSTKVYRSPVSGLKPWDMSIALWLLGALLERESTNSDLSSCWLSWKKGGICAILEFRSLTNPTYCLVVSLRGFYIL